MKFKFSDKYFKMPRFIKSSGVAFSDFRKQTGDWRPRDFT